MTVRPMLQLWHRRRLVAVGAVLALVVGTALAYRVEPGLPPTLQERGRVHGVAAADLLVDAARSQTVDLGGEAERVDAVGLIARARLLANLVATSPLRDRVARRAGVDTTSFMATAPAITFDTPRPPEDRTRNVMAVTFDEGLPIVRISVRAADEATAARIASAGMSELSAYVAALTAQDAGAGARKLIVRPLGRARHATVVAGERHLAAVLAAGMSFTLWCAVLLAVAAGRGDRPRRRRRATVGAAGTARPAPKVSA